MIFAAATDTKGLFVFSVERDAVSYCEGIDVEEGGWLFWDADGRSLSAEFSEPSKRSGFSVENGRYTLVPEQGGAPLLDYLWQLTHLDNTSVFSSLQQVRDHLQGRAVR